MRGKLPSTTKIAYLLIAIGTLGLIASCLLYFHQPKPPSTNSRPGSIRVVSAPSSIKPSQRLVASYTVPPLNPKFITIPAINVTETRVIPLGLLSNGAIATPDNIYDTGWYEGSSKPGQTGAMFIYGHVSSWTADGVFYNLKHLEPGDLVNITRGDNKKFTYKVEASKVYPYNRVNMNQVLSPINPNVPGLNLMTCTGQVIEGTSEFNERLVVFTSLAG